MFVSFFHCNCLVLFSTIHFSSSQQVGFGYHHLVKMSPEGLYCLLWVFSIRTLDFFEAFEAHENLFFLGILHSPSVCDTRPQSLARLSVIILFCCLYLSTCRVTKHLFCWALSHVWHWKSPFLGNHSVLGKQRGLVTQTWPLNVGIT